MLEKALQFTQYLPENQAELAFELLTVLIGNEKNDLEVQIDAASGVVAGWMSNESVDGDQIESLLQNALGFCGLNYSRRDQDFFGKLMIRAVKKDKVNQTQQAI